METWLVCPTQRDCQYVASVVMVKKEKGKKSHCGFIVQQSDFFILFFSFVVTLFKCLYNRGHPVCLLISDASSSSNFMKSSPSLCSGKSFMEFASSVMAQPVHEVETGN